MEDAGIELRRLGKKDDHERQDQPDESVLRNVYERRLSAASLNTEDEQVQDESETVCPIQPVLSDSPTLPEQEQAEGLPKPLTQSQGKWWVRVRFVHIIDATSGDVRDHLALERTWLAYNRTANTLASYAVVVAQLFILHEDKRTFGRICGTIMICGSMAIEVIAGLRYLQQSHALVKKDAATGKGRAVLPTPSLVWCMVIAGGISLGLFVLIVVLGT